MTSSQRGIDHVVLAVGDLDAAERAYGALGFTLTPRAHHPFGTANNLAILDGNFIEIVGVEAPDKIPPHTPERYSFAAENAAAIGRGDGLSFLVFDSADGRADHAGFVEAGLQTYEPVDFSRGAVQPDGSEETVSFTIVFVMDPAMPRAPHFVCQQYAPQHFWKPGFQRHANTARQIVLTTLAADDLSVAAGFYRTLFGEGAVRMVDGAVTVATGRGGIEVLPRTHIAERFAGVDVAVPDIVPAFVGMQVAVGDPGAATAVLEANGIAFHRDGSILRVAPGDAFGAVLEFVPEVEREA